MKGKSVNGTDHRDVNCSRVGAVCSVWGFDWGLDQRASLLIEHLSYHSRRSRMEKLSKAEQFRRWDAVRAIPGNSQCAECDDPDTSWAVLDCALASGYRTVAPYARSSHHANALYTIPAQCWVPTSHRPLGYARRLQMAY